MSNPSLPPKNESRHVIGQLETQTQRVTIYSGGLYSVATKDGKLIEQKISTKKLQAKYPRLYQLIQSGHAKGRPWLDASVRVQK